MVSIDFGVSLIDQEIGMPQSSWPTLGRGDHLSWWPTAGRGDHPNQWLALGWEDSHRREAEIWHVIRREGNWVTNMGGELGTGLSLSQKGKANCMEGEGNILYGIVGSREGDTGSPAWARL